MSRIIDELYLCASIAGEVPTKYFITSSKFGALVDEVKAHMNPLDHWKLSPQSCKSFQVRNLTVINSGSEDELACHAANKMAAENVHFQDKRLRLITGKVDHAKPFVEDAFTPKPEIVD